MADLTIIAKNVSADPSEGSIVQFYQTAEELSIGDAVYLNSDGKVLRTDANVSLEATRAIGIVVSGQGMYGETTIESGQTVGVCVLGKVYGFSSLAEGTYAWVSSTVGKLDNTAPTSAHQYIVGQCLGPDTLFVRPGISSPVSA